MNLSSSLSAVNNRPLFFFVDSVKTTSYHRSSEVLGRGIRSFSARNMASQQKNREKLDEKARHGETVVPGGTGGKSLEAQEHLAEGRSRGGQTWKQQLGSEGYHEMGTKGGQARKDQMGKEGYQEMGRKGGLSTMDKSGEQRAEEAGIDIDESKFRNQ